MRGRTDKIYDIVIFGASGFTGKYVIREALKFLKSLALAGRSPSRLTEALRWASGSNPPPGTTPLLTADTSDPNSIIRLATQAKIILNCIGPFQLYGESVVSACVDSGCDYLDICGEPMFMERMEALYHDKAVEKSSLVISACAFISVMAEIGLLFHSRHWAGPSVPNHVEASWTLESDKMVAANFGTYESMVLLLANADKLTVFQMLGPNEPARDSWTTSKRLNVSLPEVAWAIEPPTADPMVVQKTLSTLSENPHGLPGVNESVVNVKKRVAFWSSAKPAHFGVKLCSKSLLHLFQGFSETGVASDEGKTKADKVITGVMGPEVGYITTPIILLQCALILLNDRHNLPKGGVYTPGIVFGLTELQQRLQENGISFDFISKRHHSY